jgi:hypothetical protein
MTKTKTTDICFQCGKPRIQTREYKEYFNGSLVTTYESICSDPDCQTRTTNIFNKEVAQRAESIKNKRLYGNKPKKMIKTKIPLASSKINISVT